MDQLNTASAEAIELDRNDPLATERNRFHLPTGPDGEPLIYFCGHSLGLQPRAIGAAVQTELDSWAERAVDGHFHGANPWLSYHELLREDLASLVGANPTEVVAMNSLTVNLHLMMVSFYRPTSNRYRIVIEGGAFPSDQYAVESQIRFHGFDPDDALITLEDEQGRPDMSPDRLERYLSEHGASVALILLPGIQYISGQVLDFDAVTRMGHQHGCRVGFDLAHAIGNIPLDLHDNGADFAVWCSYKYLNGGPGAVGGCFVHQRHQRSTLPGFAGWWGNDPTSRFEMAATFSPATGADAWQLSNPPILALAPVRVAAQMFTRTGLAALRSKSLALTGFLERLLRNMLAGDIELLSPADPAERGCQLSLRLLAGRDRGRSIYQRLSASGVVCDWREPDVIRVAPVPFYNTFDEVLRFAEILQRLLRDDR